MTILTYCFLFLAGTIMGWILCDFLKVQPLKCRARALLAERKKLKERNEQLEKSVYETCRN